MHRLRVVTSTGERYRLLRRYENYYDYTGYTHRLQAAESNDSIQRLETARNNTCIRSETRPIKQINISNK